MLMKIVASMASCANNTERTVMRCFYEGMMLRYFQQFQTDSLKTLWRKNGVGLVLEYDANIGACDVAIQFGAAKDRAADHHLARQNIKQHARNIVYIETPVIGRQINNKNDYAYYRIGINGFLNDQGLYHSTKIDGTRCLQVRQDLGVPEFPGWQDHTRDGILILLQLPGDASLRGQSLAEWLMDTVENLRSKTKRSIVIRLHPTMSAKSLAEFMAELAPMIVKNHADIRWSHGAERSLKDDLKKSGVAITYASGSAVDAVLQGVPMIACDSGCLAWPVSAHHLDDFEDLKPVPANEVTRWIDALCMSQWTAVEMRQGCVWQHYQPIIEDLVKS